MNLGKAAGFAILLALAAFFVLRPPKSENTKARPASPDGASSNYAPHYVVNVIDLACGGIGIDGAKVTIDNQGQEIPFAKAYVDFLAVDGTVVGAADAYFSPSTIPEHSRASARLYSRGTRAETCRLSHIQDGDGRRVDLN